MKNYSVLLSVYFKENPKYLSQSLDSIFSQSTPPSEVILVKDGILTEELESVISYYLNKYSIFKIVSNPYNLGLGKSLNIGLQHCTNDLVARMDTDDIAVKDRFEKQVEYLNNNPDITVVGGWIKEFTNDISEVKSERKTPTEHKDIVNFMKWRNPFNHMTVMFRKQSILDAGSYQDFYLFEDYYLWARLYLCGYKFANIPETLVNARAGLNMLSRRGGFQYAKSEIRLLNFLLRNRIINYFEYLLSLVIKLTIRLIGTRCRFIIYKLLLR